MLGLGQGRRSITLTLTLTLSLSLSLTKVHFLPKTVKDADAAIAWCNQQDLPSC